jgi:hypothetical protein
MALLDCDVTNCTYNADRSCKRADISVEGKDACTSSETCCGSFSPRGCDCTASNVSCNCEKETRVQCEASECAYNRQHQCTAGNIGISGGQLADSSQETCCGSFVCG